MSGGAVHPSKGRREEGRYWQRPRYAWSDVRLEFTAPAIHRAVLEDLRNARRSIDFETYIFEEDPVGNEYLKALQKAVQRGVKVRLILDGIGSWPLQQKTIGSLQAAGVHVRVFRPFSRWAITALKWFFLLKFEKLRTELPWVNRRDHRKLCIIDRKVAWVGSANISQRHLDWRETAVRVQGPEMPFLQAGFEVVWAVARKSYAEYQGRMQELRLRLYRHPLALSSVRVKNKVGFTTWWSAARYREVLLSSARRRIWIVTPYFIPTSRILRKLLLAARRGADVRVMLPFQSDWKVNDWVARTHYRVMLESGIRIFEYQSAMMHAKATYVDEIVVVGSSNYNHRSLIHDFELDVVVDDSRAVEEMDQQWMEDSKSCVEVTPMTLHDLPLSIKIVGKVLLAFKFFM